MNSDLISRKALLEIINKIEFGEYDYLIRVITMDAPSVFPQKEIIEELTRRRDKYDIYEEPKTPNNIWECTEVIEQKGKWFAYDDAINIVKARCAV